MEDMKKTLAENNERPLRNEAPKKRSLRVRSRLQAGTGISKKGMSVQAG